MVYIILICLYTYLIVRLFLTITTTGKDIYKKLGPKVSIIEIFIMSIVVSYLFSYYYFQESQFENFIIPANLIWIAFTASILLLGIGIGVRFILDLMSKYITEKEETAFSRNKEVYEVFSQVWVNISVMVIFFTYALMEISKPVTRISSMNEMIPVYSLSFVLGFLFFFLYKDLHFFVRKVTTVAMIAISLCLSLFIYESRLDFFSILPITSSFLFFNISFFTTLIFSKRFYPKEFIEMDQSIGIEIPELPHSQAAQTKYAKNDLILNFGNTSIFTRNEKQAVKLPNSEVLQPNINHQIHETPHDHTHKEKDIRDSKPHRDEEHHRSRFSLTDWKLN